jgi:nucleoid-associated protein YgaU
MNLLFVTYWRNIMAEKKGIFGKAIDALTNRDEKAAAEEAKAAAVAATVKAAEAETRAKSAEALVQKAEKEKAAAAAQAAAKAKGAEIQAMEAAKADAALKAAVAAKEAAKPKIIAEHTVAAGETLSHISQKYYKQTARTYWEVIYEANKAEIGDNPGMIKVGAKLVIPELPADLKK